LTKFQAATVESQKCVQNPCGSNPLDCSCAHTLCDQGELCATNSGGIVCGTRCAAPDTPIATPSGERPIASLAVGELVLSLHQGRYASVPIVKTTRMRVEHHRVLEVSLDNGRILHLSGGHPTSDGTFFRDLETGAPLGAVHVVSTAFVDYPHQYTYDILPASDSGTYVAAGALVGSTLFSPSVDQRSSDQILTHRTSDGSSRRSFAMP
jgi:hypothetical protein